MAAPKDKDPMDVLQQTINDVLVQTGKALKAARTQGPRNVDQVRNILSTRMNESLETYHNALDDIEKAILDAKAVLMRDLERVRSGKAPVQQAEQQSAMQLQSQPPQQIITPSQFQPPAPAQVPAPAAAQAKQTAKVAVSQHMPQQLPQQHQFPPPQQFQLQQPPAPRNPVHQPAINKPVAPVPDMGVDVPTPPKTKTSPLATKKDLKGAGAGTKGGTKPSPRMNGAAKAGAKPSPNVKKSAPAPNPTPASAPAAAPTSAPAPVPPAIMTATAPVPVMDLTQPNDQFNLPANNTNVHAALAFTDMEFTVAQGSDGLSQAPAQGMPLDMPAAQMETIDLDRFFDASPPTGTESMTAPTAPMSMAPSKAAQQAPMSHDDIYDLGSATTDSMDLDFALGQAGGGSFIEDLFINSADGTLGGLEDQNNMFT